MKRGDLGRAAALEVRRRVLGSTSPTCSVPGCREADLRALTGTDPDILCAERRSLRAGRPAVEAHHVAGRRNDPTTVVLGANAHAALTHEQQTAWPRDLLRNPSDDPLLAAEARIRGSRETVAVILARPLAEAEQEVSRLRRFLEHRDPGWTEEYRSWRDGDADVR